MKTVSEMAREAGFFDETWRDGSVQVWISDMNSDAIYITEELERFAELVRADEREKAKWDVHSCGPTCTNAACVAMREAVKAERLACEKVLEDRAKHIETNHRRPHYGFPYELRQSIAAIRARGQA